MAPYVNVSANFLKFPLELADALQCGWMYISRQLCNVV